MGGCDDVMAAPLHGRDCRADSSQASPLMSGSCRMPESLRNAITHKGLNIFITSSKSKWQNMSTLFTITLLKGYLPSVTHHNQLDEHNSGVCWTLIQCLFTHLCTTPFISRLLEYLECLIFTFSLC